MSFWSKKKKEGIDKNKISDPVLAFSSTGDDRLERSSYLAGRPVVSPPNGRIVGSVPPRRDEYQAAHSQQHFRQTANRHIIRTASPNPAPVPVGRPANGASATFGIRHALTARPDVHPTPVGPSFQVATLSYRDIASGERRVRKVHLYNSNRVVPEDQQHFYFSAPRPQPKPEAKATNPFGDNHAPTATTTTDPFGDPNAAKTRMYRQSIEVAWGKQPSALSSQARPPHALPSWSAVPPAVDRDHPPPSCPVSVSSRQVTPMTALTGVTGATYQYEAPRPFDRNSAAPEPQDDTLDPADDAISEDGWYETSYFQEVTGNPFADSPEESGQAVDYLEVLISIDDDDENAGPAWDREEYSINNLAPGPAWEPEEGSVITFSGGGVRDTMRSFLEGDSFELRHFNQSIAIYGEDILVPTPLSGGS